MERSSYCYQLKIKDFALNKSGLLSLVSLQLSLCDEFKLDSAASAYKSVISVEGDGATGNSAAVEAVVPTLHVILGSIFY